MKKKLLSLFLVSVLSISMLAGCGKTGDDTDDSSNNNTEQSDDSSEEEATGNEENEGSGEEDGSEEDGGSEDVTYGNKQVIIGDQSETSGDVTPFWTNSASDYYVYKMITGLETVYVDQDGKWGVNETVVDTLDEAENEDGSKIESLGIFDI